jgi:starvation-inducible DNA-binding protein
MLFWGKHPIERELSHGLYQDMKSKLAHTRNSLPEKTRIEVAALLQVRLADSIDLMMQAKQAHWSVKGPNFIALHELFDKVYTETGEYVDLIAERIVQLGGMAQGTIRAAAEKSSLPEYPLDITSGKKHVAELAHAIAFYGELIRKAIELCTQLGDADTADIFTQISRGADSNLWFVEAHEQAEV